MAKKSVLYDAGIIQGFADRLYRQAASIIISSIFFGLIVGVIVAGGGAIAAKADQSIGMALIIGAVVGGLFGFARGSARAFKLKLDAQVALCQVQIEKNTSGK